MDDPDRPPLPQIRRDLIDEMLYKVDQMHWQNLTQMQVPNDLPAGKPRPPRITGRLLNQLQWYASVLFTREAEQYGSFVKNARYPTWLQRLADRMLSRVLDAVDEIDKGNSNASLQYHGLSRDKATEGVKETLSALVNKYTWEATDEFQKMKAQIESASAPQIASATIPVEAPSISSERKALRDAYHEEFPDVKIQDICWAAQQTYREWKRWIRGEAKDGLKPDRAFRRVLSSGKMPEEIRKQPRPTKYSA